MAYRPTERPPPFLSNLRSSTFKMKIPTFSTVLTLALTSAIKGAEAYDQPSTNQLASPAGTANSATASIVQLHGCGYTATDQSANTGATIISGIAAGNIAMQTHFSGTSSLAGQVAPSKIQGRLACAMISTVVSV
jgi:hypothetical protein